MDENFIDSIKNLPPLERTAYVLRRFCGFKYARIGGILGCETSTISKSISEARRKLTEEGFGDEEVLD